MKYKAFIFDFFGVMCPDIAKNWFETHIPGGNPEHQEAFLHEADLGKASEEETFKKLGDLISQDGVIVRNEWLMSAIVHKEIVDAIIELKKYANVAVCSNAPTAFFYTVLKQNGIEDLFDVVVVSGDIGHVKPDREIFEITCKKLGVAKEECLFFDDRKKNVDAAILYGFHGEVFTTPSQLKKYIPS